MYKIYNEDSFKKLDELEENSIDAIVTDPPYGLVSVTKRFGKEGSAPAQFGKDGAFQRLSKGFMGKEWDGTGIERNPEFWAKCLRVLKPGGYLLAFGGTRTYHRIAYAIEEAGFEIKDMINWVYGSGFPKALDIGLAIDKKMGVESKAVGETRIGKTSLGENSGWDTSDNMKAHKQGGVHKIKEAQNEWKGWKTQLKPSHELIVVAQKPFNGTYVDNILNWEVGAFNIDECRIEHNEPIKTTNCQARSDREVFNTKTSGFDSTKNTTTSVAPEGRYPANTILTYGENDKDEICGGFPDTKGGGKVKEKGDYGYCFGKKRDSKPMADGYADEGSAARYFKNCPYTKDELMEIRSYYYSAKANKKDRDEGLDSHNTHATIKPTELCQYLVRLVTPKGGVVLDPFMGSGSTGKACMMENAKRNAGYKFIGIEKEKEYYDIAKARIDYVIDKYGLGE